MEERHLTSLLEPESYPEPSASVEMMQTHISWLFLTDNHVYKIKKPVNFGFLDFSTLEKRRFYCNEEVRLNSRLSPELYEGVMELREENGSASFRGSGKIIDYAVKMGRLPADRMLDRLLDSNNVNEEDILRLAAKIAEFHGSCRTGKEIDPFGSVACIRRNWVENLEQTGEFAGNCIDLSEIDFVRTWILSFLDQHEPLFRERIARGFIRECDGDLHAENICIGEQIYVFDCIEFNDRFRYSDILADIAFLLMDLDFHSRRDLSSLLLREYENLIGDQDTNLLNFYQVYRAFVRGKVTAMTMSIPGISPEFQLARKEKASRYFRLAKGYILAETVPTTLFITCGPMGSGKSSISQEISWETGFTVISSDRIRKELAGIPPGTHFRSGHGEGLYTLSTSIRTYEELLRRAKEILDQNRSVIIDATFQRESDRILARELAQRTGSQFRIIYCLCPENTVRERLIRRMKEPGLISDGRIELLERHLQEFSFPSANEEDILTIDATAPLSRISAQFAGGLYRS